MPTTPAQDAAFIAALRTWMALPQRTTTAQNLQFKAAANTWLTAMGPAPIVVSASFVLASGYGMDALVGRVGASGSPTSFGIVSGDPQNYFDIWASGNLRTSEAGPVPPPGEYALGVTATNANGTSVPATIFVLAEGEVEPPEPPTGFPDETNTGVPDGTSLTPSGSITISEAGAVVEGLDITGGVGIAAANVTLRKCKIKNTEWVVVHISAPGAIVEDCEIDGSSAVGVKGINGYGTFRRNDIHHVEDGVYVMGGSATIEDNYIHDLSSNHGDPHYDGIAMDGGNNIHDVVIRHNSIINGHGQTSAIMIDNWAGPIDGVLVEHNRIVGGAYTVFVDGQFNSSPITNVEIAFNRVGKGQFGYFNFNQTGPNVNDHDNVDDATGNPL